ncbi:MULTISPECIES: transcriptional regulator GcvA [unclassified Mesorhizobium]|uniref:transcriptional regulator GcvA n=1 Tax=unclassified Mesorhizobium TaxID=325217 RepID=UPI000FCB20B5|nr:MULTISPECIES: transcriptional regulator GcvA [unclassified Mesorhizobium]RVD52983.1 transcriptional regulator GcvA [Mesorhizobium sp. M8A.F.Ca.ET.023.02.2.1]RUW51357.1 transcriptional regulator GcvA [Mesorhizobium sp. M8A.F.Ca.ET.021.01.1.1]RWC67972.1 MAG: transcriptional regulator GcvA [Mesorhizobium sp.]TGQ90109.1 transcriptional regulator GcvA [Mesorhizobium sp. M8A.F.Ca.ET.208.01.1.1]TGS39855.1 transcriptional regulator GcvA [Mesorhizobium sp. M8A.F.Ca.ET.182.01.1.1]
MAALLPGTRALRTLEAAARHLNFTRAADELGLTPAAVSHQIKEIEDQLGIVLFTRTSRTIRLTEAGTVLYEAATDTLDLLGRAVMRARKMARGTEFLKVTLDAQFAAKWLMRRVENFRKLRPGIELRFDIAYGLRDFDLDDVDVGIRFGAGKYPGLCAHRLFDNIIIPVCSPGLLASGPPLREPRDLFNHTLAHIEWARQGVTWPNWRMWMAAAGINDFDDSRTVVFGTSTDAVQAALDGNAVALADFAMVANDLSEGRLVRPFELSIRVAPEFAYFLVYPQATAEDPRIVAFREWILEEVARTRSADKL